MDIESIKAEFERLGGKENNGFPFIDSPVFYTSNGTPYLRSSGIALVAKSRVNLSGAQSFLDGFSDELGFGDYLRDPTKLGDAEQLTKFAGQVCYASFSAKRTSNDGALGYFRNIVESGHGSVLEHVNVSLLWWGISRTLSHELVRHRAGMGYSQLSQRFVSGKVLRFVERPEYQEDKELHGEFETRIDRAAKEYEEVAETLLAKQKTGDKILSAESRTDLRKKVQQAARSGLPGETETHVVVTGNVRAWRHVSSMRASEHAEVEIRGATYNNFLCLAVAIPMLFEDYEIVELADGTRGVRTKYPKV